ncbi:hypothetical protein BJ742DRAFT_773574 [Cladochytrium replicatum]|nr:hypothetical protein BJ742DRAFT_773574 [Cladochytrium replicatum]
MPPVYIHRVSDAPDSTDRATVVFFQTIVNVILVLGPIVLCLGLLVISLLTFLTVWSSIENFLELRSYMISNTPGILKRFGSASCNLKFVSTPSYFVGDPGPSFGKLGVVYYIRRVLDFTLIITVRMISSFANSGNSVASLKADKSLCEYVSASECIYASGKTDMDGISHSAEWLAREMETLPFGWEMGCTDDGQLFYIE